MILITFDDKTVIVTDFDKTFFIYIFYKKQALKHNNQSVLNQNNLTSSQKQKG